jgi:hypothetical protein
MYKDPTYEEIKECLVGLPETHWLANRVRNNYALSMDHWTSHFEAKFFLSQYPDGRKVLDFGCGTGHSSLVVGAYHQVVGYDPDPWPLKLANLMRDQQEYRMRHRVFFTNVMPAESFYNVFWASHVFEHIPLWEWKGVLSRLKGEGLISVPFAYCFDDPTHVNHWLTPMKFGDDLEEAGAKLLWVAKQDDVIRAKVTL